MSEVELAGSVCNTVFKLSDSINMFLIVCPWRTYNIGLKAKHILNRVGSGAGNWAIAIGNTRLNSKHVTNVKAKIFACIREIFEYVHYLCASFIEALFDQEATIEDHFAVVGHARRLLGFAGLAASRPGRASRRPW